MWHCGKDDVLVQICGFEIENSRYIGELSDI